MIVAVPDRFTGHKHQSFLEQAETLFPLGQPETFRFPFLKDCVKVITDYEVNLMAEGFSIANSVVISQKALQWSFSNVHTRGNLLVFITEFHSFVLILSHGVIINTHDAFFRC